MRESVISSLTFGGMTICIALPDTVLEEHPSLRDRTVKIGGIARTCSIFGVDMIQVFRDPQGKSEASLMKKVLEYLETPQYLRKRTFQFDEALKFAGLLPPLRIPSHKAKIPVEKLKVGEFREGFVLEGRDQVDVGLDEPVRLKEAASDRRGRVTVRISNTVPLEGVLVKKDVVREYWGYRVEVNSLKDVLSDTRFEVKIATSRRGDRLEDSIGVLAKSVESKKSVKLLFGSPSRGLFEIVGDDLRKKVDFVVNLFAEQHVVTVRTEESITAALSLLNAMVAFSKKKV